jgi:radical SAM superfamily enzyme YgiQ (UPF0313 family)
MYNGNAGDSMEPLAFAYLKALTPDDVAVAFHDERLALIPFDDPTDAVALSINSFTARRAYQIAQAYRSRGIPVIAGGFHPTLCPDEALSFVDAIATGDAEDTWPQVVEDLKKGVLTRQYASSRNAPMKAMPDRSIFAGRKYVPVKPLEFGRVLQKPVNMRYRYAMHGINNQTIGSERMINPC